jgi:hypothetical protein
LKTNLAALFCTFSRLPIFFRFVAFANCIDDSLLFRTINNQADSVLLQNDLASLQDWEDKWQMSFNAKKCQVIRITPKNRPPLPTTYKLHAPLLVSPWMYMLLISLVWCSLLSCIE